MEYLLKSALITIVLFAFYKVFLQRETFFQSIRWFFIIGVISSIVLPLLIIPIYVDTTSLEVFEMIEKTVPVADMAVREISDQVLVNQEYFNWFGLMSVVYVLGVLFLLIKFSIDLGSFLYLIFNERKQISEKIIYVELSRELAPFSFLNYIVYNKDQFSKSELKDIVTHEKVHVEQKHSIDILLIQFVAILQWFNPFVWLLKKEMQQNLEYIADKIAQEKAQTKLKYQYLLLRTRIKNNSFALSNNFFNSHLKKRIIMLQKSQTNRLNQLKYLVLIPLITLFLYSFNTKKVFIPESINSFDAISKSMTKHLSNSDPKFISPINKKDLIRISSVFGMRTHSKTKSKRMHNGVDFASKKGVQVLASSKGEVIFAAFDSAYGNFVKIVHENGFQTNYAHMNSIAVKLGGKVNEGDVIGTVGNTGDSSGDHLHFEILKNGKHVNPLDFLSMYKKSLRNALQKSISAVSTNKKSQHLVNVSKMAPVSDKKILTENFSVKINSTTTSKKLQEIKVDFKDKCNVDVDFLNIKRNTNGGIKSIKIEVKNEKTKSSFSLNQEKPIQEIKILYLKDMNEVFIGRSKFDNYDVGTYTSSSLSSQADSEEVRLMKTEHGYSESDGVHRSGSISYKGKTYYYSMNKPTVISCVEEARECLESTLSDDAIRTVSKRTHNGLTFYNYGKVIGINFYDRFGRDVSYKLARKLRKQYDTDKSK